METAPRASGGRGEAPRFLADAMLGRLATWLRILGYDAEYFRGEDEDLLRRAWGEERLLLTRDTRLLRRRRLPPSLFIQSDHVREQLHQVVRALGLQTGPSLGRRCLRCNTILEPRAKVEAEGLVPEFVWSHHQDFWGCPRCRRIYWAGTHRRKMEEAVKSLWA
ncbi:MAG TPA: Mut7-C RNAse domain-containing protein [Candidatus Methylomirabilis sp.]|nr:Mut7-C RNAse domain-containing protein [Candidatus Methylomirabilis sp.]